ncbi:MAG: hypothetical protein KDA93_14285 [Planctomycetaceae bacterium]|nr:hypothetical protein [Planctomycetaceae bacterium]
MTRKRQSDPAQPPSGEPPRTVGQRVFGALILTSLAAAVVYAVVFREQPETPPASQPVDPTNTPVTHAPTEQRPRETHDRHDEEFVGSQTCADCHSEIAETFAKHPMALTMATVAEASPIEVCEGDVAEFEAFGCKYHVERIGDRMVHTEFMTDDDGEIVYEQSVDVDYSVGSGTTARTYLIDRGGILYESPISWYVDKQKWDLSPGYQDNPRQRFNRRVSDGCVQCHAGRVAYVGDGTTNRYESEPFLEKGIGCERCHGPGARHVAKMESGDLDTDSNAADNMLIVNPSRLDAVRAESICYQCHRDGKRRILRKGKSYHDFRPGMATEDIWTVFASTESLDSDESNPFTSQVQQMHASACFRGSNGEMRCTSCHDPHHAPSPEERAEYYRVRCHECHADRGCSLPIEEREPAPAFNSCIHCHMPTSGSSDIPHTSQSDHRVLRDPLNTQSIESPTSGGGVWTIYDKSEEILPPWELQRAKALSLSDQSIQNLDRTLTVRAIGELEAVLARDPNDTSVLRSLAFLYGILGQQARAAALFEAALQIEPDDEVSLKNLGLTAYRSQSYGLALQSYQSFLKLNQWDVTMYGPYIATLAASRDMQTAVEAAEFALRLDPTQRELRGMAAQLYAQTGEQEKAIEQRDKMKLIHERLDPWDQLRRERIRKQLRENLPDGSSQP